MMRIFEFRCLSDDCGEVFDDYVEYTDIPNLKCPQCGSTTKRQLCAPTIDPKLGPIDAASFPTMGDKWARVRRQRAKIESDRNRD